MSVREYLSNKTIVKDIGLLLKNTDKIFKLFNLKTIFSGKKEESESQFSLSSLKTLFNFDKSTIKEDQAIKDIDIKDSSIIYVNGILTTEKDAIKQQKALENTLNKKVGVFYNQTGGLIIDLLESSYGRNLEKHSAASESVASSIIDKLNNTTENLTLIGHSQGAIILNNALEIVQDALPEKQLKKLTFITFGGALNKCDLNDNISVEHFVNKDDPVPNLGLLRKGKVHSGDIYERDATGHFFVRDYLHPFKKGEFGGNSNFYKLLGKKELEQDLTELISKYKTNIKDKINDIGNNNKNT